MKDYFKNLMSRCDGKMDSIEFNLSNFLLTVYDIIKVDEEWKLLEQRVRIGSFDKVSIYMYKKDHNPPHFHVRYQGCEGVFNANDGSIICGDLSGPITRKIGYWYKEIGKEYLLNIWNNQKTS